MSWKTVELGDICEFIRGLTYSKVDEVEFSNNAVLRATNIDLESNKLNLEEIRYINSSVKIKEEKKVKLNDILICTASGSKSHLGKVALINEQLDMAFGGFMAVLRVKNIIEAKFLFNYLTSDIFLNHVSRLADGANINNLKFSQIQNLKINLPSLASQQKIVAKLDAIFAEIDTATAAAEANANNAEALFQSYLTEVFERGGEGWETKKLCEVSSFDKNQGLHNGIPYIGMENIQSHTTQLISGVELVEEVKSSTFKFNETHLLYGRLRPYLNKVYAPDFVGHCSTEIFPIKPFSNLLRAYLKYWFINVKTVDRINATCTGARMPRANMNAVMDFDFPLPPISIQKQLIEYFDRVQNSTHIAIDSYKAKIAEITALKKSILQKAFSGELVKD